MVKRQDDSRRLKPLVLDSVSSPITRRVYNLGLDEFFAWYEQEPRADFTKASVSAWRVALEARGAGRGIDQRTDHSSAQAGGGGSGQRATGARAGQRNHSCEGCGIEGNPIG